MTECYAAKSALYKGLHNLRKAEEQQNKQQIDEKEDRAGGRGKSKAKDHTLQQQLVYRQEATPEARNHRPTEDQYSSIGTAIPVFVFTAPTTIGGTWGRLT